MRTAAILAFAAATLLVQPMTVEAQAPRVAHQPANGRPYSAAIQVGDTYWFSGKIGVSQETRAMTEGRVEAETHNIMRQFKALFDELGMGFEDLVQATVYLVNLEDYGPMNEAYGSYFEGMDAPARETVVVKDLVAGSIIEISFVGVKR